MGFTSKDLEMILGLADVITAGDNSLEGVELRKFIKTQCFEIVSDSFKLGLYDDPEYEKY